MATSRVGKRRITRHVVGDTELSEEVQAALTAKQLREQTQEWEEWMPSLIEAIEYGVLDDHLYDLWAASKYRVVVCPETHDIGKAQRSYEVKYLDGEKEFTEVEAEDDEYETDDGELPEWQRALLNSPQRPNLAPGYFVRFKMTGIRPQYFRGEQVQIVRKVGRQDRWSVRLVNQIVSARSNGRTLAAGTTFTVRETMFDPTTIVVK